MVASLTVPKPKAALTSPSCRWRPRPNNRRITLRSAGAPVEPVGLRGFPRGETAGRFSPTFPKNQGTLPMTLLDRADMLREGSIPVLETARLVLRPPRLDDAKSVVTLASDRRVAENTTRIPHPYTIADAREWIGAAISRSAATYLITVGGEVI